MKTKWWGSTAVAILVGGAGLAAAPATQAEAAVPDAAAAVPTSVTLFLKAPHAQQLQALAAKPVVDRAQRLAQLQRLVPGTAQHASVVSTLQHDGLTVTSQSAWSITATAPSSVVAGLFGTRPSLPKTHTAAQFRAATGALPAVPASLSGLVSGAFPTTGGPAAYAHHTTAALTGPDVRNADTPAHVAPSTGTKDTKLTIATLQLATFSSSDLTNYANNHDLADPVAAGRYKAIDVDGGPGTGDALGGGDIEVDLDQESLLSTAPSASQHAYFAPNTDAGFADVFSSVYDDAAGTKNATSPDPHLAAMSVSWGECEALTTTKNVNVLEPILQSVVAAGVTIFASAGDDGIYDCGSTSGTGTDNTVADVDFPASSPEVISTGGTNLSAPSSTPNTGANWTETMWQCTDASSCQNSTTGTGGGGGGVSGNAFGKSTGGVTGDFKGFAKPEYQKLAVTTGAYAKVTKRMVPDIAADGDPSTGFEVYTSDPMYIALFLGNTGQVGGTSLAAPLSAAQLTNTLGDAGRTSGVGDIHGALYSAYARTKGLKTSDKNKTFRDVTQGTIGATADKGADPSVSATTGYDTASGLGGVLWSALKPYLLETKGPAISARLQAKKPRGHARKSVVTVRVTWKSAPGTGHLLVDQTAMVVKKKGSKKRLTSSTSSHGTKTLHVKPGTRLVETVYAKDLDGHTTVKVVNLVAPKAKKTHHHHR